ncbi:MAG: alpha/beta hydrolase [Clostridia bacterium]|nr:alpha/beta hydrolase [Clostridia bacterium]
MAYSKFDKQEEKLNKNREKHPDQKHQEKYNKEQQKIDEERCKWLVKEERSEQHIAKRDPLMAHIFDVVEESRARPNGKSPFVDEIKVIKDVPYKTVNGETLVLDIYLPSRPVAEKSPAILDIPGGGWMIHNRNRRDGYARLYAVMGAVVFVIDHRLSPKIVFPENLEDCIDAFNFIVDNAEKYNVNKDLITVTGDSSGGHLTACLSCAATDEIYRLKLNLPELKAKPKYNIFISGAFSTEIMYRIPCTNLLMVRYINRKSTRKKSREWDYYKELTPYNYLNKDFPESYNNGGVGDLLCLGEAKRMAGKLDAVGVKNEFNVGKVWWNSGHCYVLRTPFKPAREDTKKYLKWYMERMKDNGLDMSANYARIEKFLDNYKAALKGDIEC